MTPRRLVRWPIVVAALVLATACGEPPAATSASVVAPPPPPPSVLVAQAGPAEGIALVGWLPGGELVYVAAGAMLFLWEPRSGRMLDAHSISDWDGMVDVSSDGVVIGDQRLRSSGAWDRFERGTGDIAPSHDRTARIDTTDSGTELVLEVEGHTPARVATAPGTLSFSHDGQRIAVCSVDGIVLRDSTRGTSSARSAFAARYCAFSSDGRSLVVLGATGAALLDAQTLSPVGPPIEHARSVSVSADGRRIAVALCGAREGISVLDAATRDEIAHVSMRAPDSVAMRGSDFVVVGGPDGGLYSIPGRTFVVRAELDPASVTDDGRIVQAIEDADGPGVIVLAPDGTEHVRMDLAVRASLELDGGLLRVADGARRIWYFGHTLEPRAIGVCELAPAADVSGGQGRGYAGWGLAERALGPCDHGLHAAGVSSALGMRGGVRLMPVRTRALLEDGRLLFLERDCIARDDGTVLRGSFDPRGVSADGSTFVSNEDEGLVVRDVATGGARSVLAMPRPTGAAAWRYPRPARAIELSRDGRYAAVAADARSLVLFDAQSGRLLGEASFDTRDRSTRFSADGTRLLREGEGCSRTLLRVPRLQTVASWRSSEPCGRVWIDGDAVLESRGDAIEARSLGGRPVPPPEDAHPPPRAEDDDAPFDPRVRVIAGEANEITLERARDGARVRVLAVVRGGRAQLVAFDARGPLAGAGDLFQLRSPVMTSIGMIPAPERSETLEQWLAGPP